MSICLTWFPISGLGKPKLYHDSGVFYKKWEGCGGVLDSWMIVQLIPLKRFGSECKICYKNGVQSFSFFNTNPYH